MTLAHQYVPEHHSTLEELARSMVDPQAPCRWELRLYSRDYRLATSEVSQQIYTYIIHTGMHACMHIIHTPCNMHALDLEIFISRKIRCNLSFMSSVGIYKL